MRKIVVVLLLLCAVPLCAQPLRVSVFVSNPQYVESNNVGRDLSGGVGVGLEYRFLPRWSAELSVAREEHTGVFMPFDVIMGEDPVPVRYEANSYPVDVATRYHFFTSARWQPYLGVGARYVNGPETDLEHFDSRFSAQAIGGVDFNATDRLGLRFDAKRLLRGDATFFDDTMKVSVGVTWKF